MYTERFSRKVNNFSCTPTTFSEKCRTLSVHPLLLHANGLVVCKRYRCSAANARGSKATGTSSDCNDRFDAASQGRLCRVLFQPFSEADDRIFDESEPPIERDGIDIVTTNL